ncbi:hypothetical protein T8A63_07045 [Sulfitobacter sp. OXR-159]|uniref:hypothetical protein n=1 Tax=Sulfitobacter sp. OXR-159 TaxID=3100174 RepID=UPI002AC8FC64|nr:hypothetical protein [Sulfitobacter sp. OXR-159]WPZ30711.1 hypothetical protein T8A63_06535 [Sulfitobacter sp. OXR-159]WPZ30812.1 hypothetical protein T8A63_07045 [Sulfitobacter sp. OXR-159]
MSNALDDLIQEMRDTANAIAETPPTHAASRAEIAELMAEYADRLDALPGLVKPLVWEDHPKDAPVISQAFVQGGGYFICDDTDDFTGAYLEFVSCDNVKWWQHVRSTSVELQGGFHDEDVTPLKAVAQAHYTAQIMAAFGIDTAAMREGKDA